MGPNLKQYYERLLYEFYENGKKSCLVQQLIEKITLEVDAKIYFLTKIAIFSEVKILYSIFPEMNVTNAVLII